jgi:hypothetical protein
MTDKSIIRMLRGAITIWLSGAIAGLSLSGEAVGEIRQLVLFCLVFFITWGIADIFSNWAEVKGQQLVGKVKRKNDGSRTSGEGRE